jgi:hypothetical protein
MPLACHLDEFAHKTWMQQMQRRLISELVLVHCSTKASRIFHRNMNSDSAKTCIDRCPCLLLRSSKHQCCNWSIKIPMTLSTSVESNMSDCFYNLILPSVRMLCCSPIASSTSMLQLIHQDTNDSWHFSRICNVCLLVYMSIPIWQTYSHMCKCFVVTRLLPRRRLLQCHLQLKASFSFLRAPCTHETASFCRS